MHSIRKILISLKTQMNNVVDDFENHEALAALAIEEIERIGRSSRIQLNRVRNRIGEIEKQIDEQKESAEKWSERAVRLEPNDTEAALNCVKRMKEAEKQIGILEREHRKTVAQESRISRDLSRISEQLAEMKTRRENLISRQNIAKASGNAVGDRHHPAREANAIFERWESRVVGDEFDIPAEEPHDAFADRFEKEEQEEDLKATLASLVEKYRQS